MPDHVCHPSVRQDPNIHREERTPWKVNFVVLHIVIFKTCFGAFKSWVLRCELYSGHSHCLSYEMRTWATPLGQLKEKPTRIPLLMQAAWVPLDNSTCLRNLSLQFLKYCSLSVPLLHDEMSRCNFLFWLSFPTQVQPSQDVAVSCLSTTTFPALQPHPVWGPSLPPVRMTPRCISLALTLPWKPTLAHPVVP